MTEDLTDLTAAVEGAVLEPGDQAYDEARHVWNARFEREPDVIARCADADDVAAAVRWARDNDVRLSVKGGGHSYAGNTVADEGLLVDLSPMRRIEVDAARRRARVQAGATWGEVDAATQQHGLATTGVTVSSVGVAGSTLGGGSGYLSRLYGNALDNLLSVDVVTVDGEQLRVTPDDHPELWWGLRGAGHNLAIATTFEYELHTVGPEVLFGQVIYPFDEAESLLVAVDEFLADAPDELQVLPFTFRVPPIDMFPAEHHGDPVLDLVVFHTDPSAYDVVQPLRELAEPILDVVGPTPYVEAQQAFDPNLPEGLRYYSKAHDLPTIDEGVASTFAEHVRRLQGDVSVAYFEPRGGAAGRVGDATAMGGRDAAYGVHVLAGWADEADDERVMGWARDFHQDMAEHATGGVYVNLIAEDEQDRVQAAFSDAERVRALKQQWDPQNVLRGNHNVAPG